MEKIHIDYENNTCVLLYCLFYSMNCDNIMKIFYTNWEKHFTICKGNTGKNVLINDIDNLDIDGIKLIFMEIRYGLDILPKLQKAFPSIPILYFTNDYPIVYGREACKSWQKDYKILPDNVYTVEIGKKDTIIKYVKSVFSDIFPEKKLFELPYFFSGNISNETINNNCCEKILFSGSNSSIEYEQRKKFIEFVKCREDCVIQPQYFAHSTYTEYLRSFLAVYAGPVNWHYKWNNKGYKNMNDNIITAKCFEIPASGALLVADDLMKEMLEYYGFIDMKNCVYINLNNNDEKIKFIVNPENRNVIDEIRENGRKHVHAFYTEKIARETLNTIIGEITGLEVIE
jgi:hypothetical protein